MKKLSIIFLSFLLASCASLENLDDMTLKPFSENIDGNAVLIPELKGPPITAAVYKFEDQTGQRKPGDNFAQLSTAVTQGAHNLLISSLMEVNEGKWFTVVERRGLEELIKERQLIRSTRDQVGKKDKRLPHLLFAGIIFKGGIVGYDSNTKTGGAGARYLGIGVTNQYREDIVTISLRMISVANGEVLLNVMVTNTVYSTVINGNVFKFLSQGTKLVEMEAGDSQNEPVTFALKKAVDKAVFELITAGIKKKVFTTNPAVSSK